MADDKKKLKQAQTVYADFCTMLDEHDWKYDKADNLVIETGARGDDLAMDITIRVDADRQLVILHSPMPFVVPENMRKQMAVAVSRANHGMVDGDFDYDYESGKIYFRLTTSFRDSLISKDVFEYVIGVSCSTIDDYNDKFLAVVKKEMTVEQILNYID